MKTSTKRVIIILVGLFLLMILPPNDLAVGLLGKSFAGKIVFL